MVLLKKTKKLNKLFPDVRLVEKTLVYLFMKENDIDYKKSPYFVNYFNEIQTKFKDEVNAFLVRENIVLDLNVLVEIFELLLLPDEKRENGMVYTPIEVKEFIIKSLITDEIPPTVCDPACGCGSFLVSVAKYLHVKYEISYAEIFSDYIFGVDIVPHNIEKVSVLLHLLAIKDGEIGDFQFNLVAANSLAIDWEEAFQKQNGEFNIVLGNPPYVRSKNITDEVKATLLQWETSKIGNTDLYIPFYELGLKITSKNGKLGYISVNTFLKSLNGRIPRKLLIENQFDTKIIDFNHSQIFKNSTNYTCITFIDKSNKNGKLGYNSYSNNDSIQDLKFLENNFSDFDETGKKSWHLGKVNELAIISKFENAGSPLGIYPIKNGLATLKNDLFFFTPIKEDENYFYREYQGEVFKIEKEICKNVAKPNVMKNEEDLDRLMEKAIFPYIEDGTKRKFSVIPEEEMSSKYPEAYNYFGEFRDILEQRDKGKGKYPAWYAYGRSQGMNNQGKKLLIPYMAGQPIAILSLEEDLLFYCGYALILDDEFELRFLKKILESELFWFYLKKTSKPYANGYLSTAKSYLVNFSIPSFSLSEKKEVISIDSKEELDKFLCSKYDVDYNIIAEKEIEQTKVGENY